MDWYFGSGVDCFLVPKDLKVSDRLPSPQSWSKWGISEPESYDLSHSYSFMDTNMNQEAFSLNDGLLTEELETESCKQCKDHSAVSSLASGRLEEPVKQSTLGCNQPDHYNPDSVVAGIEQIEEFFLSSLLEDLPGNENPDKPYCFSSGPQFEIGSPDNIATDMILDSLSVCNNSHSMGSSKYLKTHAFSPSLSWEEDKVNSPEFPQCNLEQKNHQSVKAPPADVFIPLEHHDLDGDMDGNFFHEESVLQQLTMVMSQMTDKTRLCLRDALYRMAESATQRLQYQTGDLPAEIFPCKVEDKTRSDNKITELETNAIDRAVAGLMFNKRDLNAPEFPISASSVDSKQEFIETIGTGNYKSNHSSVEGPLNFTTFPGDAEVPDFMSIEVNKAEQSSGNLAQNVMQQFYINA